MFFTGIAFIYMFLLIRLSRLKEKKILFLTSNSTSDGIHLTQHGHNAFARGLEGIFMVGDNCE